MSEQKTQDRRAQYYWSQVKKHGAKYPHFHWPSVEIILNLVYTYDVLSGDMSHKISKHGITKAAFSVLMILSRSESKSVKQNEISELMLVSRANITGLVDGLVKMGLVERTNDPHDRRVNMVKILLKGEKLIENVLPDYYQYIQQMCSVLSVEDKKILSELLTRLRKKVIETKA